MQSPIFSNAATESQERFTLQTPHLLRVNLNNGEDVVARTGSMVAFEGMLEFDGEYQSQRQQGMQMMTGEVLPLMRCFGQGSVYLANLAQHIHVMDVDHDGLTVDSGYVLALDAQLHWDVVSVESQHGIASAGAYNLVISGRGKVAIITSGKPLAMQVTPDKVCNADADAVVAWSSSLRVQMQAQTVSGSIWRRQRGTGEGWEMNFMGQGHVLVQPSELLPPQQTAFGAALGGLFQQGQPPGTNQRGAWG